MRNQSYVTLRNIKVLALSDLGRIVDILPLLRSVMTIDNPMSANGSVAKQTFCKDVVSINNILYNSSINQVHNYILV